MFYQEEIERFKSISIMEDIFSRERYALIQFVLANTRQKSAVLEQAWKNIYETSYTLVSCQNLTCGLLFYEQK